jgi:hypothetical protein
MFIHNIAKACKLGVKLTKNAHPAPLNDALQVASTSTERRLFAQVDLRREMRPIAFVDPGAFVGTNLEALRPLLDS